MTRLNADSPTARRSPRVAYRMLRRAAFRQDQAFWLAVHGYGVTTIADLNDYELIPVGGR